jgi:hemerythrin
VEETYKAFEKGEVTLSKDLMEFLKEWLVEHIMGTDKKGYGKFFNDKGIY